MINNLKEIRKKYNMTQAELSEKMGRTAGYVSLLENGRVRLNEELKKSISMVLGCRIDEIKDYQDSRDVSGIPERLKFLRKEKGITQRQFASMVGCSYGMAGGIETGRVAPSDEMLQRIARTFNLNFQNN